MLNIDRIIERIKNIKNIKKQSEVAELFNISNNDFSNRKKRGTLIPIILDWALKEEINLDWLLKGENKSLNSEKDIKEKKNRRKKIFRSRYKRN